MIKSNRELENNNEMLLFWKAYDNKTKDQLGSLCPPTDIMFNVTRLQLETFVNVFDEVKHVVGVRKHIITKAHTQTQLLNPVFRFMPDS